MARITSIGGARTTSNDKSTLFNLYLDGLSRKFYALGNLDRPRRVVDSWIDHRKLPPPCVWPRREQKASKELLRAEFEIG
ncbi:hypothetical protein [Muricoccus radiodurans]|uniref:hypothetical protein n=1 Tax=Muricoccus radiodurans TaxID=2231721 RepID=UPI003CEF0284